MLLVKYWRILYFSRSRGSTKGKDSEYENLESDVPDEDDKVPLNISRDSEQREIDEFEQEEQRLLAEEEKVIEKFSVLRLETRNCQYRTI